jgi:hypothetical protein
VSYDAVDPLPFADWSLDPVDVIDTARSTTWIQIFPRTRRLAPAIFSVILASDVYISALMCYFLRRRTEHAQCVPPGLCWHEELTTCCYSTNSLLTRIVSLSWNLKRLPLMCILSADDCLLQLIFTLSTNALTRCVGCPPCRLRYELRRGVAISSCALAIVVTVRLLRSMLEL